MKEIHLAKNTPPSIIKGKNIVAGLSISRKSMNTNSYHYIKAIKETKQLLNKFFT